MKLPISSMSLSVIVSSAALLPSLGHAQTASSDASSSGTETLQEIIVTAQRRTEDLQKAAASVSVRLGDELLEQGKYRLSQILEDVPGVAGGAANATGGYGLSPSGTDSPASGLIMRGIPSNLGIGGGITSVATSAAIYVDDVYAGFGGGYDIHQIEILRGPQGTLYGRSATTGVLAIHTADPDPSKLGGFVSAESGNYALQHYSGAVNIPLVNDVLAVRASGNYFERNGYDSAKGGALSNSDGRIKLLYQPTENFSALLGAIIEDNKLHAGGVNYTEYAPGKYAPSNTTIGKGRNTGRQYWGDFNWTLGSVKLTYIPAYRQWRSDGINYVQIPAANLNSVQYLKTPKDHFWTHEVRLASASSGKLTWQVGALYYRNDLANSSRTVDGVSAALYNSSVIDKKTTSLGEFGEFTFAFTDSWRFTGGLRYDSTDVQGTDVYTSNLNLTQTSTNVKGTVTYALPENDVTQTLTGPAGRVRFNNTTYKARLEHDLTPQNMVYALTSTGVTPGDISLTTGSNGAPTTVPFNAETLRSYEIGSKNRFFDNRLQLNADVFYYIYGGYQVATINISTIPGVTAFSDVSAPARAHGGEAELLYLITPDDQLGLNVAYTKAYFVDRESQIVPGTGGKSFANYFALEDIPSVVPWTVQTSYEHTVHIGGSNLVLHGDARYMSGHEEGRLTQDQLNSGAEPYVHIGGKVIGNVTAGWNFPGNRLSVTGYVRNVGGTRYMQYIGVSTTTPGKFGVTPLLSDPRTYGAVLTVKF